VKSTFFSAIDAALKQPWNSQWSRVLIAASEQRWGIEAKEMLIVKARQNFFDFVRPSVSRSCSQPLNFMRRGGFCCSQFCYSAKLVAEAHSSHSGCDGDFYANQKDI
jgi:hypothetical protein